MKYDRKTTVKSLKTSSVSVVISVSLVLFLFGTLLLLLFSAKRLSDHVKGQFEFTIFLKDAIEESQITQLKTDLQYQDFTESLKYVDKEEAAKEMEKELDENFTDFLGMNPMLNSFDLKLKPEFVEPGQLEKIEQKILANEEVLEVEYDRSLIKAVYSNIQTMSIWLIVLSGVFLLICFTLINGNIRLSIYSKRFSIKTMQLVGATPRFIRKPFLKRNILFGFIGGIISFLTLFGFIQFAENNLEFTMVPNYFLYAILFLVLVGLGILITFFSTLFSLNKFLRLRAEELYG